MSQRYAPTMDSVLRPASGPAASGASPGQAAVEVELRLPAVDAGAGRHRATARRPRPSAYAVRGRRHRCGWASGSWGCWSWIGGALGYVAGERALPAQAVAVAVATFDATSDAAVDATVDVRRPSPADELPVSPSANRESTITTTPKPPAVYYKNCGVALAEGAAPIQKGEPGYRTGLDPDGDGVACPVD